MQDVVFRAERLVGTVRLRQRASLFHGDAADGLHRHFRFGKIIGDRLGHKIRAEVVCRRIIGNNGGNIVFIRRRSVVVLADHIVIDVLNEIIFGMIEFIRSVVIDFVRNFALRVFFRGDGDAACRAVKIQEHFPALRKAVLFIILHAFLRGIPVGLQFLFEKLVRFQNIFFGMFAERRKRLPRAVVVLRPVDDRHDPRFGFSVEVRFEFFLFRLVEFLRSVSRKSLDVDRIHRARTGISGIEIHVHIEQNVLDGERRAVAEL